MAQFLLPLTFDLLSGKMTTHDTIGGSWTGAEPRAVPLWNQTTESS